MTLKHLDSSPAVKLPIYIDDELVGYTNNAGDIILSDVKTSIVKFTTSQFPLRLFIDNEFIGEMKSEVFYLGAKANTTFKLKVVDVFNDPISNAKIFMNNPNNVIGLTNKEGVLETNITLRLGEIFSGALYEIDGYEIPTGSVIIKLNDSYYYVSRWPPGPSIMINVLSYISAEALMGILSLALVTFTMYKFSQKYFDEKLSFMLTLLTMFSGVVLVSTYTRWMGDLPSMAFSFLGFYLLTFASLFLFSLDSLLLCLNCRNHNRILLL
jgi:hypothetical protein